MKPHRWTIYIIELVWKWFWFLFRRLLHSSSVFAVSVCVYVSLCVVVFFSFIIVIIILLSGMWRWSLSCQPYTQCKYKYFAAARICNANVICAQHHRECNCIRRIGSYYFAISHITIWLQLPIANSLANHLHAIAATWIEMQKFGFCSAQLAKFMNHVRQ